MHVFIRGLWIIPVLWAAIITQSSKISLITLNKCDKVVILRYCSIDRQSELFDCEKKAFFSVLGVCIVLTVDFNG